MVERVSVLAHLRADTRSRRQAGIGRSFRIPDARISLKYLYPKIEE